MAKKIIKARLKQRTDTQANWAANNPVLLEGELGLVTDDKNLYKVGDGVTAWNDLPFRGFDGTLVHETGDSDSAAMSQRGVTRALAKLEENMANNEKIKELSGKIEQLEEENTRLKERIEEQDVFIEDLEYHKLTANADNRYPKLSVGTADNLAGVDVVDSEINFRRSGGGAITDGVARIETIKGNSVVWNQRYPTGWERKAMGLNLVSAHSKIEISGTLNNTYFNLLPFTANLPGHIYAFALNDASVFNGLTFALMNRTSSSSATIANGAALFIYTNTIEQSQLATNIGIIGLEVGRDISTIITVDQYDLTQMFGSGNEPTTIEEFYQRAPMGVDLNAYNEGEVIHMGVQSIESQGVNAWGGKLERGRITNGVDTQHTGMARSVEYIEILPNTEYYCFAKNAVSKTLAYISMYDKDKRFIEQKDAGPLFTTSPNASFIRFFLYDTGGGVPLDNEVCINLSDTAINGKYYPYIKKVEDLAVINKYFPGGMKSAPTAHDAIRYNKESGKREKVEAIGIRAYQDGDADNAAYLTDGKVTCYPLAEPIVTELDKEDQLKDWDYSVWNDGTERAIAEGKSSALAADITYGFNAIGKIKELEGLVAQLRAKVGI